MGISDRIEAFIVELLKDEDDWLELKRNELASVFGCVPSQINYVISTRFNRDRGYVVESRRGGGGYLKIRKISTVSEIVDDLIQSIGNLLTYEDCVYYVSRLLEMNIISTALSRVMLGAVSEGTLNGADDIRAEVFKGMVKELV